MIPFFHKFMTVAARHVPDARNAICVEALEGGFSHVLMIDADQRFPDDTFARLWNILEDHGHEQTIASGWATIKTGKFAGEPSVFRIQPGGTLTPIREVADCTEPVLADTVGTPCLLFHTRLLGKVEPPWFADIFVCDEDALARPGGAVVPTEYKQGQDLTFSHRMGLAGVKFVVDPILKLPHEIMAVI